MSMKKTDLEKNKAMKLVGGMKSSLAPDRFAQGAVAALDKKERRARDAAAGLVPFACKLPVHMARQLAERAGTHEGGLNALVAALLEPGLAQAAGETAAAASAAAPEPAAPAPAPATDAKPAKAANAAKAAKAAEPEVARRAGST